MATVTELDEKPRSRLGAPAPREDGASKGFGVYSLNARSNSTNKMIGSRTASAASRAAYASVHLPRAEQRQAPGEPRPHSVYLVRLETHLGT